MTTNEIDRLSRILTDMRIESAAQFARLDERLRDVPQLTSRVVELEKICATSGRFTWGDVFKAVAAVSAAVAIYATVIA